MFVMFNAVLIGGVFPLENSNRNRPVTETLDVERGGKAGGYIALYFFYGFLDGAW